MLSIIAGYLWCLLDGWMCWPARYSGRWQSRLDRHAGWLIMRVGYAVWMAMLSIWTRWLPSYAVWLVTRINFIHWSYLNRLVYSDWPWSSMTFHLLRCPP
jgi:hypothetical protein